MRWTWPALALAGLCLLIVSSLLLMGIQAARESARRMSCSNNLKLLGLALYNYLDTFDVLPPACGGTGPTPGKDALSNQRRLSGLVELIPYIEASSQYYLIYEPYVTGKMSVPENARYTKSLKAKDDYLRVRLDALSTAEGPLVMDNGDHYFPSMGPAPWLAADYPLWQIQPSGFRCPSDPIQRPDKHAALLNYAFCYGDGVYEVGYEPGVYLDFRDHVAGLRNDPGLCLKTVTGERQSGLQQYPQEVALRMTPDGLASRGGNWADGAITWSGFNTILPPNSPSCDTAAEHRLEGVFSAASNHAGGCMVVMADGSVRFITADIDCGDIHQASVYAGSSTADTVDSPYGVWGAMGTRGSHP